MLILFAFASGALVIFAASVRQRRAEIVVLCAAEGAARKLPNTSKGNS